MDNNEKKLSYSDEMLKRIFSSRTCLVCGKKFTRISFSDYAYKLDGKYFCSYSCMRKYEKNPREFTERPEPKRSPGNRPTSKRLIK